MKDKTRKSLHDQVNELSGEVENLFYHLLQPHSSGAFGKSKKWQPPTDILETEQRMIIKIELAGVEKPDVNITLHDNRIVVAGVRREIVAPHIKTYQQMEINYGEFERIIELPPGLDKPCIEAKLGNGFLTIIVNKRPPKTITKKIDVEVK